GAEHLRRRGSHFGQRLLTRYAEAVATQRPVRARRPVEPAPAPARPVAPAARPGEGLSRIPQTGLANTGARPCCTALGMLAYRESTLFQGWVFSPHDIGRIFHDMAYNLFGENRMLHVCLPVRLAPPQTALPDAAAARTSGGSLCPIDHHAD